MQIHYIMWTSKNTEHYFPHVIRHNCNPFWISHWQHTVYPNKYAHGFCFAVLCCGYTLTYFPISTRLTSLALWQSNDCPSASKATLMNMDKYFMWIHYERLRNHNKAKHNKTMCIFLGMYCSFQVIDLMPLAKNILWCCFPPEISCLGLNAWLSWAGNWLKYAFSPVTDIMPWLEFMAQLGRKLIEICKVRGFFLSCMMFISHHRADTRFAPSQWATSLQSGCWNLVH